MINKSKVTIQKKSQWQYDLSVLKAFFLNSINISVQSEGMEPSYPYFFKSKGVEIETKPELEFLNKDMLELAIFNKLKTQQNERFFDFREFKIPFQIQKAFAASIKIHTNNLSHVPVNYQ